MDYKQKYEELIVRLKSITSVQPDVTKQVFEGLFHEIVDGFEDERIRKGLFEYFTGIKGSPLSNVFYGLEVDDIIAWLERQKSTIIPKFRVGDEVVPKNGQEESLTITKVTDTEYYSEDLLVCRIDEQEGWELVEQKHAEWSEEDINMIDWLIRCCEKEHEELCNDRYGHQDIVSDLKRDCRKKWDWLESLKEKVAPQKQLKPTEEQIRAVEKALSLAKNCGEDYSFDLRKLLEQLKAL